MNSNFGWYFPKNAGGMEEGFANQGINQFKVAPYQKLAREIIQNSYDARKKNEDGSSQKVKVVFELSKISKDNIPQMDYIMECIEASKNYYMNDKRLDSFYNSAKKAYNSEYIKVLKISDYNTTGLTGIDDSENRKEAWYGLIKSSGNSTKSGTTGGSYGAGKHAPFVFSNFRTIFYSTYVDGEGFGFQGKSILCTHEMNNEKKSNVGFWGRVVAENCFPIRNLNDINEYYRRMESGTDLFIIGAKMEENWNETVIRSVIENFWMLILEDKLEVVVKEDGQSTYSVNCQNIRNLTESLAKSKSAGFDAHKFMQVYFDDVPTIKGSIIEPDDVELKIAQLPEYAEKKILMMRSTEMKIKVSSARKRPINYIGIFRAIGEEINELLRMTEPQTHDDWNADNVEDDIDKIRAKKFIKKIDEWINEQINRLAYVGDVKEFDAEGLDFLNIEEENSEDEIKQHNFDEFVNQEKPEEEIAPRVSYNKNKAQTQKVAENFGVGGEIAKGSQPRERKNGKKPYGSGENLSAGGARMHGIELSYLKTPYDSSNGTQSIILKSSESVEKCNISLNQFTDSDEVENIDIEYATCNGKKLDVSKNVIKNVSLSDENTIEIKVKFKENIRNVLEVSAYVQE